MSLAPGTRLGTYEIVEGQTRQARGPRGLPVARVVELGIALGDALTAAHEKGAIHGDLKPTNVMLTCEGCVSVIGRR